VRIPVGGGGIRLRGTAKPLAQPLAYDLTLEAESVPLASVVRLVRQAKQQLPRDLTASGSLNAEFRATRSVPGTVERRAPRPSARRGHPALHARHSLLTTWTGTGAATDVRLSSNAGKDEVALGTVPLTLVSLDSREGSPLIQGQ